MKTTQEILDELDATPEERDIAWEAIRRVHEERAWDRRKAEDPTVPRQARYKGLKAADVLSRLDSSDRARWIALYEAVRAGL